MIGIVSRLIQGVPARRLPPDESFDRLIERGDKARDCGQWSDAARLYEEALELRPKASWVAVQMGHALKENGEHAAAQDAYHQFLTEYPQNADIHLQLGHLCMRRERFEEASAWYQRALDLAGDGSSTADDARRGIADANAGPLLQRRRSALAFTDYRRFAEAQEVLVTLIERDGCEDLTGIMGNVAKELGRIDEAKTYYARYYTHAQTAGDNERFDAELQMGHLAKLERDYNVALSHFASADRLFDAARQPSCSRQALDAEIRTCLAQITTSISLG